MAVDTSEASDNLQAVFTDEQFWYKIDVDWESVKESIDPDKTTTVDQSNLESIEDSNSLAVSLLHEFTKGKKKVIEESGYTTTSEFTLSVFENSDGEIRKELRAIYVEYQWSLKQKQDKFTCDDLSSVLSELASDHTVIRDEVNDLYDIIWPGNNSIDKEVRGDEVTARKLLKTDPVIVKKSNDGQFVIRGAGKSRGKVVDRVRSNTTAEEIGPDYKDESVSERVHEALSEQDESFRKHFKIIDVRYKESALPARSTLRIKNDQGLDSDLNELRDAGYLPTGGMAGLSFFRVEDIVYGGRHKIELEHHHDGFLFKSEATRKTDKERDRFEKRFSTVADIEFDTIYQYGAADDRYLLNRVLSEDYDAYKRFYEKLPNQQQEFVDDVLQTDEDGKLELVEKKQCLECGYNAEIGANECDDCGEINFADPHPTATIVDNNAIASKINYSLKDISPTHGRVNFLSYETTTRELRDNRVAEVDVKMHRDPDQSDIIRRRQVFFAPTGSGLRIRRFNDYLLEGVYVTYGSSDGRQFTGYGSLSLYDLLFNDDASTDELVGNALYDAFTGIQDRATKESREAYHTCKKYQATAKRFDQISENEEELKQYLGSGAFFEKNVFYLLKFLFERTERWGKENERESDGAVIFPRQDQDKYHIFSFDAKLSYDKDGYNFTPAEEDQATRYILHDNDWHRLKVKTGGKQLDAHIMISQNFNKNHFQKMADNIVNHFATFSPDDVETNIAFMELDALIDLFEIKRELYEYRGSGKLVNDFNRFFHDSVTTLNDSKNYSLITPGDIEKIDGKMTRLMDEFSDDRLRPYSPAGRD